MESRQLKMKNGLEDCQNPTEFLEQFSQEDKQRSHRLLNCRLYADFQSQSVRQCDVFDVYKNCLKLLKNTRKTGNAIPISVLLCPLEVTIDLEDTFEYEFEYSLRKMCGKSFRLYMSVTLFDIFVGIFADSEVGFWILLVRVKIPRILVGIFFSNFKNLESARDEYEKEENSYILKYREGKTCDTNSRISFSDPTSFHV